MTEHDDPAAWIERLRHSQLRLDREGRWWHEEELIRHRGLCRALHRWLDQLEDGRFVVRLDGERYAYVAVDDAPFMVRTLEFAPAEIAVRLSDESLEALDLTTLFIGDHQALYCHVRARRFVARFSRQAQQLLSPHIEADEQGFRVSYAGHTARISGAARLR